MNDSIITEIESYRQTGSLVCLYNALRYFIAKRYESMAEAMLELSIHFEEGAKKYGEYNWQKGLPPSSFVDSGVRHYFKWLRGDEDERHDRAFMWNIVCLIWTEKYRAKCTNDEREDKEKAAGSEKMNNTNHAADEPQIITAEEKLAQEYRKLSKETEELGKKMREAIKKSMSQLEEEGVFDNLKKVKNL